MADPATLMLAGTAVGVAAGFAGSGAQSDAAGRAAGLAAEGINLSTAEQRRLFGVGQEFTAPFRGAGVGALPTLEEAAFRTAPSPGFELARKRGIRDLSRGASAAGKLGSGSFIESVADLNDRLVAQEAQRRQSLLTTLSGTGASSAASAAGAAESAGRDIGSIYSSGFDALGQVAGAQGAAKAAKIGAAGQIIQGGLSTAALASSTKQPGV